MWQYSLLKFLARIGHGVQLVLDVEAGVVAALQQLLSEQLQGLERACAGVHLSAVLLWTTAVFFITLLKLDWLKPDQENKSLANSHVAEKMYLTDTLNLSKVFIAFQISTRFFN